MNIFVKLTLIFLIIFSNCTITLADNTSSRKKVLLICLDGATWNIMKPLIERDELPNFSHLTKNGVYGELFSGPAYSPPSWASLATGKTSKKHGVYDFSDAHKIKTRYVWSILNDFNIKTVVVEWNMAIAEKIDGAIAVFPWYAKNGSRFYPDSLGEQLENAVDIIKVPPFESVEVSEYWNLRDKNTVSISMYLIEKYCPSFMAIGFLGTNPYQHRYWGAMEPQYFDITYSEVQKRGNLIIDYYKKIDNYLTYFIKNDYTIIFVSDHGFCRNDVRTGLRITVFFTRDFDKWSINFLINRMLWTSGLLNFINKPEGGAQIDFTKSKAYFYNNMKLGIKGIRINREVVQQGDVKGLIKKISIFVRGAEFEDGRKVFANIEVNESDQQSSLPDIGFKLGGAFQEAKVIFEESENGPPGHLMVTHMLSKEGEELSTIVLDGKKYPLGAFIDRSRDGVHEKEGVLIMAGDNIVKNKLIGGANILDITPTILYLLGLPIARDMDGRVLIEAFTPEYLEKQNISYIDSYDNDSTEKTGTRTPETVMKSRLRSLGYAH